MKQDTAAHLHDPATAHARLTRAIKDARPIDVQWPRGDGTGRLGQSPRVVLVYECSPPSNGGRGRKPARRLRITLAYDAYKSQAWGRIEVWDVHGWTEILILQGEHLAVGAPYSPDGSDVDYSPDIQRLHAAAMAMLGD